MTTSHFSVFAKHATIPAAETHTLFVFVFLGNIKTIAGGAQIGASTAVKAFDAEGIP